MKSEKELQQRIKELESKVEHLRRQYDAKSRMCFVYENHLNGILETSEDWDARMEAREVMATAVLGYASCMSDSSFCEYSRKELEKIQDTRARGEEAARERAAFARARITFRARKGLKPDEAIYAPTVENMRIANNPTPVNPDFCE